MSDNAIVHFDISGPNDEVLGNFYAAAFGWAVTGQGPGYAIVETPGGLRGSIVEAPIAKLSIGVQVGNVEAAVADVTRLGGTVLMPPTDNGWVLKAEVRDPAGNAITLIQGFRES